MGRRCASCGEALGSLRPGHTRCRRCWALPHLLVRAQRLAGVDVLPMEQCGPAEVEAASALLEYVMAPGRGGV